MNTIALACLLGLALASATDGQAQTLNYSGKVVDQAGTGLPWALIRLDGGPTVGQSDANGNFTLTGTATVGLYPKAYPEAYPDVHPRRMRPMSLEKEEAAGTFLSDGRILSVTHGAAGARFPRSQVFSSSYSGPIAKTAATSRIAAAAVLGVSKVNYQDGSFPQPLVSATGLVLALAKSATDTATYAAEKKICLDTVNACRATLGLKPVVWSKSLEAFADEGARYDAGVGTAHTHFGKFSVHAVPADAENALPGWPIKNYSVASAMKEGTKMMWDEGPGGGHYENIKGDQTSLGCGVFVTAKGEIWIVQDFK